MNCEICGAKYRKVDTFLICDQGHTLQNTLEVANDDGQSVPLRIRRVRIARREKKIYRSSGCHLMRMVLMRLLFDEAREHFGLPDDNVFKYFTGFFEFKKTKLETCVDVTKNEFFVLVYLSKRMEMEKEGRPYTIKECKEDFKRFDITTRLLLIKNRFPALEPPCYEFVKTPFNLSPATVKHRVAELTDMYMYPKPYGHAHGSENGIFEEGIEFCKHNIRRQIRNDLEMAWLYFKPICEFYNVPLEPKLRLYFAKFIYVSDPGQVHIPEYDYVLFLASLYVNKKVLEDTDLETRILTEFVMSRKVLIKRIMKMSKILEMSTTPELYMVWMSMKREKRFKRLRHVVEFIDAFKRKTARTTNLVID